MWEHMPRQQIYNLINLKIKIFTAFVILLSCGLLFATNTFTSVLYFDNNIKIESVYSISNIKVITHFINRKHVIDFNKLKIPFKQQIDLLWKNEQYACSMVWWSQSQSRYIFLPLNDKLKFIYLPKDIESMDSLNNNIVYIDTVFKSKVIFKLENLLTRKAKKVELKITDKNCVYPFYDTIALYRDSISLITPIENITIPIKELYGY